VDLEEPIPKVSTVEGYISYVFKEETFYFEMFIYPCPLPLDLTLH
jgi:hypothetical protein